MKPFFHSLEGRHHVHFIEIIPNEQTSDLEKKRAVYEGLIRELPKLLEYSIREMVESLLRATRQKALDGELSEAEIGQLLQHFLFLKEDFRRRFESILAYRMIKVVAMQIAQTLFVNNCMVQGIMARTDSLEETISELADFVQERYDQMAIPIETGNARFYASYFVIQTLFDKLFVGNEEVVIRNKQTGEVRRTPHYARYTTYLELSGRKLLTAGPNEKALCEQVTTGWGDGIDEPTWNALNQDYYSGANDNFFSNDYDDHLDKMIPQFPWGRARAATTIVAASGDEVNLIEIGAGSGTFAVDYWMALKQQSKELAKYSYQGLEPSMPMRASFGYHFQDHTGELPPEHWRMLAGSLETFLQEPAAFIRPAAQNILVFSYSAHHCYRPSLQQLLLRPEVQEGIDQLYILDGTLEHGWTKMTYMPLDCRSPEDFRNLTITESWSTKTLWHEPQEPMPFNAVINAWCMLRKLTPPRKRLFTRQTGAFVVDLDGTLYRGESMIEGADVFLEYLINQGWPFLLMTNRSERTPAVVLKQLQGMGIKGLSKAQIYSSAMATAELLKPGKVYMIGGPGLSLALGAAGFTMDSNEPDYVILGLNMNVNYEQLSQASQLVSRGAEFVVTNPDLSLETDEGLKPGNGAIAAVITQTTGKQPRIIGKPMAAMYQAAAARLGVQVEDLLVLGDNLETDIRGGQQAGAQTILTLTGVSDRRQLERTELRPDLVVDNLIELTKMLQVKRG